ncbi:MAG TPA: lipid-A-disaccharide synthase, partial [Clostridia bacterium]|nr:lipid-A-disaccharide synthase [Clostridia bacterium]
DFSGFNRRFAHAIKKYVRSRSGWFQNWNPKIIQFVSPQVWASREGRAYQMAKDYDLLLTIFPFEKAWYARRVPQFQVEFVGHPMLDRYAGLADKIQEENKAKADDAVAKAKRSALVLLLPGSRESELRRHLPVMKPAVDILRSQMPDLRVRMVLPNERLVEQAQSGSLPAGVEIKVGGLPESLQEADLAIASTGTVTMECAYFGVPTVALYKTSWSTYQIGKRIVKVKYLGMPNLLADEVVFPEFVQDDATSENIARAALELLRDEPRRQQIKARLGEIITSLGGPGASKRAAEKIAAVCRGAGKTGKSC